MQEKKKCMPKDAWAFSLPALTFYDSNFYLMLNHPNNHSVIYNLWISVIMTNLTALVTVYGYNLRSIIIISPMLK